MQKLLEILSNKNRLVLIVIYISFLCLGFSDQILGIAWPEMRLDFFKELDQAGVIIALATSFSAVSAFSSGYFIYKFSISKVLLTAFSIFAVGMYGYAFSQSWYLLMFFTAITGMSVGIIGSVLNNYISANYDSCHLNWLYGFWGIGSTVGPALITTILAAHQGWRLSYLVIAVIQTFIVLLFAGVRRFWTAPRPPINKHIFQFPKVTCDTFLSSLFFFIYTTIESSMGLWLYSNLIDVREYSVLQAGFYITAFWGTITFMRFTTGAATRYISNKNIITFGILIGTVGLSLLIPLNKYTSLAGLILTAIGFAGIFPGMINETHKRFGPDIAPVQIGWQVGSTYLGYAIATPFIGFLLQRIGLNYLQPILVMLVFILILLDTRLRRLSCEQHVQNN